MTEHEHRALSPNERRSPLTNTRPTPPTVHTDPPVPTPPAPTPPAVRPRLPRLRIDRAAVSARYRAILTTGNDRTAFRAALVDSVTDVPALLSEVDRLWLALVATRRRYANLVAATRAALGADRDGEADPLSYLRDELPELAEHVAAEHRGRW